MKRIFSLALTLALALSLAAGASAAAEARLPETAEWIVGRVVRH